MMGCIHYRDDSLSSPSLSAAQGATIGVSFFPDRKEKEAAGFFMSEDDFCP
jgi:hypothetical protein